MRGDGDSGAKRGSEYGLLKKPGTCVESRCRIEITSIFLIVLAAVISVHFGKGFFAGFCPSLGSGAVRLPHRQQAGNIDEPHESGREEYYRYCYRQWYYQFRY